MSNSKKKNYKKRKQSPHIKVKEPRSVPQASKLSRLVDEWLWLITLIVIVIAVALMMIFIPKCDSYCGSRDDHSNTSSVSQTDSSTAEQEKDVPEYHYSAEELRAMYPDVEQFKLPAEGEEIAVLETDMGTIKLRLFPDKAPKAVENFKGLINNGYYNGLTFHRTVDNFVIQSGDPDADGFGGESLWGTPFEDELLVGLHNFRGALSMANSGPNTNGSQFFIVSTYKHIDPDVTSLVNDYGFDETIATMYQSIPGPYWLDGETTPVTGNGHTTFGQVIEGMDVVEAIAAVEVNDKSKPLSDVIITKAYLTKYNSAE